MDIHSSAVQNGSDHSHPVLSPSLLALRLLYQLPWEPGRRSFSDHQTVSVCLTSLVTELEPGLNERGKDWVQRPLVAPVVLSHQLLQLLRLLVHRLAAAGFG